MATHIPIYVDGERKFVDDSWYSDLDLARKYFGPEFGEVKLIGPSLPIAEANANYMREVGPEDEGLSLYPSVDARTRIRDFWPKASRRWHQDLAPLLEEARVVHASVDDPFRPMQLASLRDAFKAHKPTVLIGFDMDVWDLLGDKLDRMGSAEGKLHIARTVGMDVWFRVCLRKASVAMLKEGLVHDRYASIAKNPRAFCHSMHSAAHLIDEATFDARVTSMRSGRGLRFAYFGRFIERKGLADAIRIVASARSRGVDVTYDLIGEGPQQAELEALAASLGVAPHIRFPGAFPYGDELHARLRTYDGLLFTPTEEDTPRMVYDAFAAGLPLITSNIPFLERRAERDRASLVFGIGAIEAAADALVELDGERGRLEALSLNARAAGEQHTVESWYGKRLAWTLDAVERHEHAA